MKYLKHNMIPVAMLLTLLLVYVFRRKIKNYMDGFKHFNLSEFDQKGLPGSGRMHMKRSFVRKLDRIRSEYGKAMRISSGYRTPEYNRAVGGSANSAHTRGHAADIVATGNDRLLLAAIAVKHGITRIGFGNNFIHLDDDPSLAQFVTWGYGSAPNLATFASLQERAKNMV